jgi:CheY-like chemotaxis protein/uncharacterized protein YjbI with pentapeptide repeats
MPDSPNPVILLLDDEPEDLVKLQEKFERTSYDVRTAHSYSEMKKILDKGKVSLIILDQFFTNIKTVHDYLCQRENGIVACDVESVTEEEKAQQGFLILEKLRKDGIATPVMMVSAQEQSWRDAYQKGARHLLDKKEIFTRDADFLLGLVQEVLNDPSAFLGDTFSYNGILCDTKLRNILEDRQKIWRGAWKDLVQAFLAILQKHNIRQATSRHFYDYAKELPYDNYRRQLTGQEIQVFLKDRFPGIVLKREYKGYYLYHCVEDSKEKAVYVLRDTCRYTRRHVSGLRQLRGPGILNVSQTEYLTLPLDAPFSPNDGILYFHTPWQMAYKPRGTDNYINFSADELDDFHSYCAKFREKNNYDNLQKALYFLYQQGGSNSVLPDNTFMFVDQDADVHIRYLGISLECLFEMAENREAHPGYLNKNNGIKYFGEYLPKPCDLAYIHIFYLLYYWLKNKWPGTEVIENLAKKRFLYFQNLFRAQDSVTDIFSSFYRQDKELYTFIYSAFAIGLYEIHHPVILQDRQLAFDREDTETLQPAIRNIIFKKKVKLSGVTGNKLRFENCEFRDELLLEGVKFEEICFRNCGFVKLTVQDSPHTALKLVGCTGLTPGDYNDLLILKGQKFEAPIYIEECGLEQIAAQNTCLRGEVTIKQPRASLIVNLDKTEVIGDFKIALDDAKTITFKVKQGHFSQPVAVKSNVKCGSTVAFEGSVFDDALTIEMPSLAGLTLQRVKCNKELVLPFRRIGHTSLEFSHFQGGLDSKEGGDALPACSITLRACEFHRTVNLDNLVNLQRLDIEENIFYFPFTLRKAKVQEFYGPSIYREVADFSETEFGKLSLSVKDRTAAIFTAETRFRNSTFQDMADFSNSTIKILDMERATFKQKAPVFINASIGESNLSESLISQLISTRYRKLPDKSQRDELRGLLRELKNIHNMLTAANNFEKADEIYVIICKMERLLSLKSWWSYWGGWLSCRFGTSFWRPLIGMVILTIGIAGYLSWRQIPITYVPQLISIFCGTAPEIVLPNPGSVLSWDIWAVCIAVVFNFGFINLFIVTLARRLIR